MRVVGKKQSSYASRSAWRRGLLFLACLWLFLASVGCQTHTEVDGRPQWMRQADAQLQEKPQWRVSGEGAQAVDTDSGVSNDRPTTNGGEREPFPQSGEAQGTSSFPNTPPGARWGETKVTVEVEE